jgi:hypothetical protein
MSASATSMSSLLATQWGASPDAHNRRHHRWVGPAREQQTHNGRAIREIAWPISHHVQKRAISACAAGDMNRHEIRVLFLQVVERLQVSGLSRRGRSTCEGIIAAHGRGHQTVWCTPITLGASADAMLKGMRLLQQGHDLRKSVD